MLLRHYVILHSDAAFLYSAQLSFQGHPEKFNKGDGVMNTWFIMI